VRDAGFEPVVVGSLASEKPLDIDSPVLVRMPTAKELRRGLRL
jgi:hypothetical protein